MPRNLNIAHKKRKSLCVSYGGSGEIRTPEPFDRLRAFQARALDHYATLPKVKTHKILPQNPLLVHAELLEQLFLLRFLEYLAPFFFVKNMDFTKHAVVAAFYVDITLAYPHYGLGEFGSGYFPNLIFI